MIRMAYIYTTLRDVTYVGRARNRSWREFAAAAYNLVRMAKLELAPA